MEDIAKIKVLNKSRTDDVVKTENLNEEISNELIKQLRISMTNLKANFMDDHTGKIKYKEMIESSDFVAYRRFVKLLYTVHNFYVLQRIKCITLNCRFQVIIQVT